MEYILIRSRRKTVSLQIDDKLNVVVKAPVFLSKDKIEDFVLSHEEWINEHLKTAALKQKTLDALSDEKIKDLKKRAKAYIFPRVEYYSQIMGLNPLSVKITSAKKRFGSCSGNGNICFSYLLMLYPKEAVDYVIVHELSHIKHHNHGKEFYKTVEKYMPDYKQRVKVLRQPPTVDIG